MKMKKVLTTVLSLSLVAALSIAGTIAYLTSTDSDVNVMTLGNVKIAQHEYERVVDENGNYVSTGTVDEYTYTPDKLQNFTQGKPIYPAVYKGESAPWSERTGTDGSAHQQSWGQVGAPGSNQIVDAPNVIDKFVFVENTGKSDAYYRTIVAVEMPEGLNEDLVHIIDTGNSRFDIEGEIYTTINDVKYLIRVYTYNQILKPEEVSRPSFLQVYLDKKATNEDCALFGDTWEILVYSQAVQADGFTDAKTALDTAFGKITATNLPWGDRVEIPTVITASTSEELAEAIEDNDNVVINLEEGDYTTNLKIDGGKNVTINGTKDTVLSGQIATTSSTEGTLTLNGVTVKLDDSIKDSTGISQTSKSAIAIWGNQTVICNNVTFDMTLSDSTAITSWWDTGVGTTIECYNCTFNCNGQRPIRATGNVTVENCTFNDPYRYAVQLTAKSSTATLLDKAIINFNNNTIVNGENGKEFVYGIQLEGADYGCNNLVINGAGNTIVDDGEDSVMYYCECGKVQHETIEWNVEVVPVHKQ